MATKYVNTHPQFTVYSGGSFAPASDGEVEFFDAGTTGDANRRDTYNTPTPSDPPDPSEINANPVPLDGYGRTTVPVFLIGSYNTVIRDSAGNQLDTVDDVVGYGDEGTATITVDNVTDLAALDTTLYQAAYALGKTTVGDGGQGWWYYSAGSAVSDNGSSVIEPDIGNGRWLKQNNSYDSLTSKLAGGTVDAITITTSPVATALDGTRLFIVENVLGANTVAGVTVRLDSTTILDLKRDSATALKVGDTGLAGYKMIIQIAADLAEAILLNPFICADNQFIANTINADKLVSASVTQTQMANNSIGNDQMRNDAVNTAEIVDQAVSPAKLLQPAAGDTYVLRRFVASASNDFETTSNSYLTTGLRFTGGVHSTLQKIGFAVLISGVITIKYDQIAITDSSLSKIVVNGTEDIEYTTTAGNTDSRSRNVTVTRGDVVQVFHRIDTVGTSRLSDFRVTSSVDTQAIA